MTCDLHSGVHQAGPERRVPADKEGPKSAEERLANVWVLVREAAAALFKEESGGDDARAHDGAEHTAGGGGHVGLGVATALDDARRQLENDIGLALVAAGEKRECNSD